LSGCQGTRSHPSTNPHILTFTFTPCKRHLDQNTHAGRARSLSTLLEHVSCARQVRCLHTVAQHCTVAHLQSRPPPSRLQKLKTKIDEHYRVNTHTHVHTHAHLQELKTKIDEHYRVNTHAHAHAHAHTHTHTQTPAGAQDKD